MKYLKIVIAVLVLAVVGIGAYYMYMRLKPTTVVPPTDNQSSESAIPYQFLAQNQTDQSRVGEIDDYTSADLGNSTNVIYVTGKLVSIESIGRMIGEVSYNRLINITSDTGALQRVWITRAEYLAMVNTAADGDMVTLTLSKSGVTIEK